MTKKMLINATHPDELRVAIIDNSTLIDLDIEHPGQEQKKSNIYKGRITSIEPSLGAVFVDYGSERHGFLPLKEISSEYFLAQPEAKSFTDIDIKKILREGQEIVVQIDKEERGTKGAALTTFITLAGCYLVLMPNNPDAGGISRRIEGEERDQLRQVIDQLSIPEGMGVIIRTAGVSRSKEELEWDLKVLLRYWEAVKQAAIAKPGPYLIHQEGDVIIRAIRDHLRQDVIEVVIDKSDVYHRAKDYIRQVRPDFLEHIKLYTDAMPLFSRFQIERQIEAAYEREVRLPSGGSIVIDHSEALVAIDINSSRATKGGNIEETALQTNLEAADEIAKQVRIRDIGGLIVIDFIDMTPVRNQREVEDRLRTALEMDRARIQIGRISRFGLLEMSRQRLRASLSVSTQIPCPRCEGRGSIRSVESVAISILHLIAENASRNENTQIQVQLPIDVATYLANEERDAIKAIEKQSTVQIVIIPNKHLRSPDYQIKNTKDETLKTTPSYKLVRVPKPDVAPYKPTLSTQVAEPAIQQYLASDEIQPPAPKKPQTNGLIKRLWDAMFGSSLPEKTTEKPSKKMSAQRPPRAERFNRDQRSERFDRNQRPPRQEDGYRGKPRRPRDGQPMRRDRDNRDTRDKYRNRDRQGSRYPEKTSDAAIKDTTEFEAHKPVVASVIDKEFHAPVPETMIEKPAEIMIEKKPEQPIVAAETPKEKEFVPPPVPTAPANYKGLSSAKPLQQVVTKK